MGEHQFDRITQEILKQKQRMDSLLAENHDLQQQIADLRSGRGIFVDIYGSRFALRDDSSLVQTDSASSVTSTSSPLALAATDPKVVQASAPPAMQPTPTTEIAPQTEEQSTQKMVPQAKSHTDKKVAGKESTFLEEMLLDEFTNALTSPNAVWQDPSEKKQAQQQRKAAELTDEEQKAALRRELMGSFLLE
jgi:hypothetical protein